MGDLKLSLQGILGYDEDNDTLSVVTADAATNIIEAESGGQKHGKVGGLWEAQLFGKEKNTNLPTGVAGAFNAHIANHAVVVGGFGATK